MDAFDKIRSMQKGQQYSIVAFTLSGTPYSLRFRLVKMRYETTDYGQAYVLTIKPALTRYHYICLSDDRQFIIWDGLVVPDTNITSRRQLKDYDSGMVERVEVLKAFDPRYLVRAKESVLKAPFMEYFKQPTDQPAIGHQVIN